MCSGKEGAIRRVVEAIDNLEAERAVVDASTLAARIAAIWSMVGEIHPELARLASRYGTRPAAGGPGEARTGAAEARTGPGS